ncbi:hypothetical protein BO71DRAFT_441052 [Aspergillus ellipticus CBS 707.79]|uniref:Uncharacterized protein n=1 Tax=Aspergillus ellipticus CBS 707.79 TaxID=1448320 RepID=A0A319E1I2_9EURO|nr:hypothetical protein BO71DRAFT_441052 [Aspergillus ellipticus CBS 707.79]
MAVGEARAKRHSIFRSLEPLLLQVNALDTRLVEIDKLRDMEFHLVRAELGPDEKLQFDPCYFEPLEASVFEKYPLAPYEETNKLYDPLSYERMLHEVLQEYPDEENQEEIAWELLDNLIMRSKHDDQSQLHYNLCNMVDHIDTHVCCDRVGIPGFDDFCSTLKELATMTIKGYYDVYPSKYNFNMWGSRCQLSQEWKLLRLYTEPSKNLPHAIATFKSYELANDGTLTIAEIRGIVRWIIRMHHRRQFRCTYDYQFLSIWYMGPKHGRIIQSHHDGERMVVQYSPLMSFEDRGTAPTSLFV